MDQPQYEADPCGHRHLDHPLSQPQPTCPAVRLCTDRLSSPNRQFLLDNGFQCSTVCFRDSAGQLQCSPISNPVALAGATDDVPGGGVPFASRMRRNSSAEESSASTSTPYPRTRSRARAAGRVEGTIRRRSRPTCSKPALDETGSDGANRKFPILCHVAVPVCKDPSAIVYEGNL